MGEGAPNFNPNRRELNPRETMLSELERVAFRLSVDRDPLARGIGEKFLGILEVKRLADQIQSRPTDVATYQRIKPLGIFVLEDAVAQVDLRDPSNGFSIKKGQKHLSLHLPPLRREDKTWENVARSAVLVAEYIDRHGLYDREQMVGVTFEKLAIAARRLGFHAFEAPIPPDVAQRIEEIFTRHTGSSQNMGPLMVVHQPIDDFVRRVERGRHHE